jgi:hypothetical protein
MKKKVTLNEKEYELKPVELGVALDALEIVEKLPDTIKELDLENEQNTVKIATKLLITSKDDMFQLLSMLSGLTIDEISSLSIKETLILFKVLLEINELDEIKKYFGEIAMQFKGKKE